MYDPFCFFLDYVGSLFLYCSLSLHKQGIVKLKKKGQVRHRSHMRNKSHTWNEKLYAILRVSDIKYIDNLVTLSVCRQTMSLDTTVLIYVLLGQFVLYFVSKLKVKIALCVQYRENIKERNVPLGGLRHLHLL